MTFTQFGIAMALSLAPAASVSAQTSPAPASQTDAATVGADAAIQARASALDERVRAAVAARRLPAKKGAKLSLAIGRVHTGAGHQATVNGTLTPAETAGFSAKLDAVEQQLPPG